VASSISIINSSLPSRAQRSAISYRRARTGDLGQIRGDKVSFTDRHMQVHVGIITRCNPKTAGVDSDGAAWSVPYAALRHVLDV